MTKTAHGFRIALDMDGVVSDFARKVAELTKVAPQDALDLMERVDEDTIDKRKMWIAINKYDAHTPFFYTLERMRDSEELFSFVTDHFDHDDIFFLTASGHTPSDAPQQKRRWIRKHFGSYHVEVVTKSKDKAAFATPTTILVDDRMKSLDPWTEAGGISILHKNAQATIAELKQLLKLAA
jgi:5'(3')-deoxyribonucleotidase